MTRVRVVPSVVDLQYLVGLWNSQIVRTQLEERAQLIVGRTYQLTQADLEEAVRSRPQDGRRSECHMIPALRRSNAGRTVASGPATSRSTAPGHRLSASSLASKETLIVTLPALVARS